MNAGIAWWLTKKSIALFSLIGFLIIDYLGYWDAMLSTLALVLTSVIISVVVGITNWNLGITKGYGSQNSHPILDFMQTMPAFVYLLPAIFFFNIGVVPGVVASVIFAIKKTPTIRFNNTWDPTGA